MNTIPTIFNEKKISHTVIGGTTKKSEEETSPFTLVLLNRGGRYYRSTVFQGLESAGFSSIVSIEVHSQTYEIDSLSSKFPYIKFVVPNEVISIGEMINLGILESNSPYIVVMWSDVNGLQIQTVKRIIEKMKNEQLLCVAPLLSNHRMEQLPVQMVPTLQKKIFQIEPMPCYKDASLTLYPFDFIGIYDKEKCIQQGGFDHSIANSYWQNMDFGFRAHLWGEKIILSNSFRLHYDGTIPSENLTAEDSYMRFFLKNLAPIYKIDHAVLPYAKLYSFYRKAGTSFLNSFSHFLKGRQWVKHNKYRFKCDALYILSQWEPDTP